MMTLFLTTLLKPDTYVWLLMALMAVLSIGVLMLWIFGRRKWLKWICTFVVVLGWYILLYGTYVGVARIEVRQVEFSSKDLPEAFDGYRIVQFSDAHVGTMTGSRQWLLQRAVDSINALKPDVIVFTGDLQNLHPEELEEHQAVLRQLRAKDGVISVLGNHDYPTYLDCDEATKEDLLRQTIDFERALGWKLLLNEHRIIRRDSDSIVIAGMENWGKPKRMPRRGDVAKT